MRYLISYLYHFIVSNSRHGTHSPFVYDLASKVIYNVAYKSSNHVDFPVGFNPKYLPLLKKILSYWKFEKLGDDINNKDVNAYWINQPNIEVEELLKLVDEGKILIVDKPYSVKNKGLWNKLIDDRRVIVSINMFHFGIVLKREGQRKEDFLLRYLG
jgi:hypothetical protein